MYVETLSSQPNPSPAVFPSPASSAKASAKVLPIMSISEVAVPINQHCTEALFPHAPSLGAYHTNHSGLRDTLATTPTGGRDPHVIVHQTDLTAVLSTEIAIGAVHLLR